MTSSCRIGSSALEAPSRRHRYGIQDELRWGSPSISRKRCRPYDGGSGGGGYDREHHRRKRRRGGNRDRYDSGDNNYRRSADDQDRSYKSRKEINQGSNRPRPRSHHRSKEDQRRASNSTSASSYLSSPARNRKHKIVCLNGSPSSETAKKLSKVPAAGAKGSASEFEGPKSLATVHKERHQGIRSSRARFLEEGRRHMSMLISSTKTTLMRSRSSSDKCKKLWAASEFRWNYSIIEHHDVDQGLQLEQQNPAKESELGELEEGEFRPNFPSAESVGLTFESTAGRTDVVPDSPNVEDADDLDGFIELLGPKQDSKPPYSTDCTNPLTPSFPPHVEAVAQSPLTADIHIDATFEELEEDDRLHIDSDSCESDFDFDEESCK